jgi:CRISPR-associated exonuclease Cas4
MTNKTYIFAEDDFIMLSALQHFVFCERQCALIHIEQAWSENIFTAEGRIMHDKADSNKFESRGDVRIDYSVPLRSLRLGLVGKADVVEFHKRADGSWKPFPVEYKRGKPKKDDCDRVQLCAQAICLEEMLNVDIPAGALFYGQTRRREDVVFNELLRKETAEISRKVHELIASGVTPKAAYAKKCEKCSLFEICMPKTCGKGRSVSRYLMNVAEAE